MASVPQGLWRQNTNLVSMFPKVHVDSISESQGDSDLPMDGWRVVRKSAALGALVACYHGCDGVALFVVAHPARRIQGVIATPRRVCLTVPIIQRSAAGGSRHEIVKTYCRLTSPTRRQ